MTPDTVTFRHEKSGADVELPTDVALDLLGDVVTRYHAALEHIRDWEKRGGPSVYEIAANALDAKHE